MRMEGSVGVPINADQLSGHSLSYLGLVHRLRQNHQTRVSVHVYESRAHHLARGIDLPRRLNPRQVPPVHADRLALHTNSPIEARVAAAINNRPSTNQQVQHGNLLRMSAGSGAPTRPIVQPG